MGSCLNLKEELTRLGLEHDWLLGTNESLVHRGRMEMCASFLRTDHTHLMWLDADIEFTPDDVAKVWNLDADIGVGVYAMKKRGQEWFAAWKDGQLVKDLDQFEGPIEVDYAGTGFMLIKREAIDEVRRHLQERHDIAKRLRASLGELPPSEAKIADEMVENFSPTWEGSGGDCPSLFMTPIYQNGLESEDYHFCRIAREAGLKIVMDPSVRLKHWGGYAYGAA